MRKLLNMRSNDIQYGTCPHCKKAPQFIETERDSRQVRHKCRKVDYTSLEEPITTPWRVLIMYWRIEAARQTLIKNSEHDWGFVAFLETDHTALTEHHRVTCAIFNPRGVHRVFNVSDAREDQYDAHLINVLSYSIPDLKVDVYAHLYDIRSAAAVWQRIADYVNDLYEVPPPPKRRMYTLEADSDGWLYYDTDEFLDDFAGEGEEE